MPTIYRPHAAKVKEDESEFYMKTPQEMSRYELAELEADMRAIAEGVDEDEEPTAAEIEEMKKDPLYHKMIEKMKQLQKLRHGVIKTYFEKHKYKKNHRNEIIQAAEETEDAFR